MHTEMNGHMHTQGCAFADTDDQRYVEVQGHVHTGVHVHKKCTRRACVHKA